MKIKLNAKFYFSIYFFTLLYFYHDVINTYFYWRYFAYLKETIFDFSWLRFVVASVIFYINLYFLFKKDKVKIIFSVLAIFFILVTIPSLIAFTSKNIYPIKLLIYHQVLFFSLYFFSSFKVSFDKFPGIKKNQALIVLFGITTIGIIPYLLVYGPYINLNNLLLKDIYQTRAVMSGLSNPYFGYTYSLFTKIIIPLLIVFAIEQRKWHFVFIGIFYLILFYLFGAHKTVYIGLVVVLIFYKLSYLGLVRKIIKYSNLLLFASIVLAFYGSDDLWILIFRRVHFLPTLLDLQYLDFFEGKPLYWSNSFLKGIIDYPYDLKHAKLIGDAYYDNKEMNANNGLISDGYMNFGSLGVFINTLIISFYFMFLNSLNISSKYFGVFFLVVIAFISSSLFTVFLTHGAIALLLLSIFLLNEKEN
ncbi:hypothetical protein [Mesoflavibacter zeaxanthinifaciens]|uniref:hypothetical protein n=1 Tax=Mesoflavibacter zeaxanthinifaciens TaxID=393060 RepID=UPI0026EA714C|nr:hypothetical protein [Mesoflavibacter zeaxanthinifaciens]